MGAFEKFEAVLDAVVLLGFLYCLSYSALFLAYFFLLLPLAFIFEEEEAPEDKVRSLGVLLDPELSLEAQVTAVARNAFLQLRLINQLRPYLEYDCLATVTHALVTSRLDFCNALYVGLPLKMVRTLQLVQNRAARLLTGTGRYAHMTPVLRQLHWLPIEARAQFKVLIMTYKALNGLGPGCLNERLRPYMPDRPLRSAGESLLREPSMKEIRRVSTRRRAFSVVAPNLWNSLPKEVRLALSLRVFRRQEGYGQVGVSAVKGHKVGGRFAGDAVWGETEGTGSLQPGEEETQRGSVGDIQRALAMGQCRNENDNGGGEGEERLDVSEKSLGAATKKTTPLANTYVTWRGTWASCVASPRLERAGVLTMLRQRWQKLPHAQGAGDALLPAGLPAKVERLLNALLLLAALHFLIQTALYFSCLFLLLPMSFVISNVISGANTIMAAASSENLRTRSPLGHGAGESNRGVAFLADAHGMEDVVLSMAVAYFLVRAGLVFCNLLFILPVIFFLNEARCS
ncbi:hypothetical protein EYD10_01731 [Varanus komodoensis]|nr:hypothetical protein EYD10_01731 [Varanus komodoensis]